MLVAHPMRLQPLPLQQLVQQRKRRSKPHGLESFHFFMPLSDKKFSRIPIGQILMDFFLSLESFIDHGLNYEILLLPG